MEIMPATLLATNPFCKPIRIPLSTAERTVNHVSWKKQFRLPSSTSIGRRCVVAPEQSDEEESCRQLRHHSNHSRHRDRRAEFRPLGSMSEKQLMRLTMSANEELEQVRKDAGIITPPKMAQTMPALEDELQLPKITKTRQKTVPPVSASPSKKGDREKQKGDEKGSVKERAKTGGFRRTGGTGYSRVDLVKNIQKHKRSLTASVLQRKSAKVERRQRCTASKVDSVCWGDTEGMIKGKGSVTGGSSTASNCSDEDSDRQHTKSPIKEKWACDEEELAARQCKSAFRRLPQVDEKRTKTDEDLSTAALEDVILARMEGEKNDQESGDSEERVPWEGEERGYCAEVSGLLTRPTTSAKDRDDCCQSRSEISTPELSEGALSNDEGDRPTHSAKRKLDIFKHSSAVIKDMNGSLSNKNLELRENITESVMKKLQPPHPHVIWPDNRFKTPNTVFVYGSPSRLAPVIVPSHSVDCPLCNVYTPSAFGEICPPNSPTHFLRKDYGFYPVERFYSDF
ncbi:uncharacterized protein [Diadema antillarum]|uniref:uncharacterized protein n=1 Tax=Diadema antillarum TaxID=105358 RepID=UPI003A84999D